MPASRNTKQPSKLFFGLLLIAASGIGCGGGGGDESDSVPSICRSYCSFGCSKAVSCGILPASQLSSCDDSCVRTIASNGTSAAACDRGGEQLAAASCSQLRTILGLRNLDETAKSDLNSEDGGIAVAEHSGAELAGLATE
jgi:hypothetical protein